MNHSRFITIFICAHVIFIFLQIHKHSQIIKYSYELQKNEQALAALSAKQEQLTQHLASLKSPDAIKRFARKKLHMRPIKLTQMKKLINHE